MFDLNFLPTKEQKSARKKYVLLIIQDTFIWIVVVAVIISLTAVWGAITLDATQKKWETGPTVSNPKYTSLSSEVTRTNDLVHDIRNIQNEYVMWSGVLTKLAKLVPEGNTIDFISMDAEEKQVQIKGFSKTRANLLAFEEALRGSDLVTDVESPLSNLLSPINIFFELNATLNGGLNKEKK